MKNLKNQTEKQDHENILKPLKIENEYYKKKYKNLNKRKKILIVTENLIGVGSTIGSSTLAILNPSAGIVLSSSVSLLTSVALLITNEYISKLKIRFTKLRDSINMITWLEEKTIKQSMVDKKNRN